LYKPKRVIEIHAEASSRVRLTEVLERGADFERVAYEPVPVRKRPADAHHAAPKVACIRSCFFRRQELPAALNEYLRVYFALRPK